MVTRPELRREMLVLGIFALFLLPLAFTVNTSTTDEIQQGFQALSLLDLLFSFLLAGIAGTIYHALFGKHYHKLPKAKSLVRKKQDQVAQFWLMRLFLAFLIFAWSVILLAFFFSLTMPTAVFLGAVLVAIYLVSHRQDLLVDTIASALLTAFIVFTSAWIASQFAQIDFTIAPVASSTTVLGVPADLLVWSAAIGLAIGPLYEFIRRFELE